MNLFESLGIDGSYLVLALLVINVALIAIVILLFTRQKKMKYNLSVFMNGKDAESLEDAMVEKFTEINEINRQTGVSFNKIVNQCIEYALAHYDSGSVDQTE